MKKPLWTWATAGRLLAFLIVAGTIVLAFAGCGVLTEVFGYATGSSPSSGTRAAARHVDEAITGWFWSLFGIDTVKVAAGAAAAETVRYTHRVHKRRKERKACKANTPSTTHVGGAS